jgi:CheY-like chemotaxis protein
MPVSDTVLLVDDDRFFLTIEKQFLRSAPVTIIEARNAEAALIVCHEKKPQLVCMAFDLPGEDGAECCRRIKADPKLRGIAVVMVCDSAAKTQDERCRAAGCDGILYKPLDRHRFLEVTRSFLAGIRETRRHCLLPLRFKVEGQTVVAKGLDISRGGLFVETGVALQVGQALELEIHLTRSGEEGAWINCHGTVAWLNTREKLFKPTHPTGFGVKFTGIPVEAAGPLVTFVHKLERGEPSGR